MNEFKSEVLLHETTVNRLHKAVKDTYKKRDRSPSYREAWSQACIEFHSFTSQVDSWLSVCSADSVARHQDLRTFVFQYISIDPYYFRSGYEKERVLQYIKKLELSVPEKMIIQNLLLKRIQTRGLREFKRICRMIPYIDDGAFHNEVLAMAGSSDSNVKRRAKFALSYFPIRGYMA